MDLLSGVPTTLGRLRASVIAAVAVVLIAAVPAWAGGDPPEVIAESHGVLVSGQFEVQFSCAARARQDQAVDTVLDCWLQRWDGSRASAQVYTPLGVAATAHGVAQTFGPWQICARAYSIDLFGERSSEFLGCL